MRVTTMAEADRVTQALQSLRPTTPDVRIAVSGGFNRPPMERSPAIAAFFEQARRIGRDLGLELTEGSTGGGSDGNFTAAMGIPTLDGLGVCGGGAARRRRAHPDRLAPGRASISWPSLLIHLQDES